MASLARAQDEEPVPEDLEEIVVEGRSPAEEDTHAHATLDEASLAREGGQDLGETVAGIPGVVAARGSSDATKPILRGHTERRLLVLFDGVRHESQKWGQDHATEIDPFAAGRVEVVKGAAGVRYGPDAIGGVVLVEPPPLRTEVGVGGRAQLVGVSNGQRGVAAARVDVVPAGAPGLTLRVEGNGSRGASVSTPDYVLGNTASATWNLGATVSQRIDASTLTASYRHYDFAGGVSYAVGAETPAELVERLDDPIPVGAEGWETSYTIDRPSQEVGHDLALVRGVFPVGRGDLQLTYAFQHDRRREYDTVRNADEAGAQYDFLLRTHDVQAWLGHGAHALGAGTHEGGIGLEGAFQENVYRGLPLLPNHRSFSGGAFLVERWHAGPLILEAGGRVDHLSRSAFLTEDAFDRHVSRGTLEEDGCDPGETSIRCGLAWTGGSLTVGALWRPSEQAEARLDLSSANRFPNADELFLLGSAPTSPVFAVGDPSLEAETTWGASPTVGWDLRWLAGEVSTYLNLIERYVYFSPELGPDGEVQFDVTVQGAFPTWSFRPIDALFYGADGGLELGPEWPVGLSLAGMLVRAVDVATGDGLVGIPPDRVSAAVVGRPRIRGLDDAWIDVDLTWVARQTHVDPAADLAPPPDAYALLGASLGAEIPVRGDTLRLGIEGNNLTNTRYRDYTRLLRYTPAEPGREVRARVGLDF